MSGNLRCIQCRSPVEWAETFACGGCGHAYSVRDGVFLTGLRTEGSNAVASRFYDGPWWRKARRIEQVAFFLAGGERKARTGLISRLGELKGKVVLEVAIGDGANLQSIPKECKVYGADISHAQLALCHRKHGSREGLRLFHAEAERLPFADASFDHVLCVGAYNHLSDRLGALKEMIRVAKPGGLILISDEIPDVVKKLPGRRLGMPALDRWILSRLFLLGPEFSSLVYDRSDLDVENEVRALLPEARFEHLQGGTSYCVLARVRNEPC